MDERPVTQYATAPDGVSLAYQLSGSGSTNVVVFPGGSYPIDLLWEEPSFSHFAKRLGTFSRTLWFASRGMGASGGNFFDTFIDEVRDGDIMSVLDSIGWEQAAFVGTGVSAWWALGFAAVHPERMSALILIDGYARYTRDDDYPIGLTIDRLDALVSYFPSQWGSGVALEVFAPSRAADPSFRETIARCERFGQPPHETAEALKRSLLIDVRRHLPAIVAPTLVLHRAADRAIRPEAGRYLAEHIVGARYVELSGEDYYFFVGDTDALLDEVEEFLTGSHQGAEGDVVTLTILFTDIVASTEQSARMGHRKWSALSDAHDAMVRTTLARYRGREVKTIGDGFLATFDATTRAVRAATDIVKLAKAMGIEVRAGVHTGEIEVRPDDVVGLAVSIAKRVCDLAAPGQVLVSDSVRAVIAGSGIEFEDRGENELKGVPGSWKLFAVKG